MSDDWTPEEIAEYHLQESEDDDNPPCECVQVDADEWDSRYCPAHGPHSESARRMRQQEADDEFAFWNQSGWEEVFNDDTRT